MMHVLVTGGAGYIGCRLVPALLARGHEVTVVDKLYFGDAGLESAKNQIRFYAADIRDIPPAAFDGVSAIIHLAGLSNDPTAEYNPAANLQINTEATITLAKQAKQRKIERFVFASSCSIYYTLQPDDVLRGEDYPIAPKAPYSFSKHEAEKGLNALADDNFSPVMLRKGTIFGQSDRMRYDLVINTFTKDAYASRRLVIHAGGRMWRPMLHIDDAVEAYIATVEAPRERVHRQVFNVLSDNFRVLNMAYEVRHVLEQHKGIRLDLQVQHVGTSRSYRVDGSKFHDTLGVKFSHPIGTAVDEIWNKLEEGTEYDNPIYYNIRWLELLTDMQKRLKAMGNRVF
jgi:nucleoside-diphosphate-sugar epimerase